MKQDLNRLFGKALATLVGFISLTAIGALPAAATDANCTQVGSYATNHVYGVWIAAANFGYTPWQINPTVTVWDRCDHGAIALNINLYNAAVQTKPGGIVTVQAFYYVPGRGWIAASPLVNRSPAARGWLTFTYALGYGGLGHVISAVLPNYARPVRYFSVDHRKRGYSVMWDWRQRP